MIAKRPRLLWIPFLLLLVQGGLFLWLSAQYGQAVQLLSQSAQGWMEHGFENPESLVTLWLFLLTWGVLGGTSVVIAVGLRSGRTWVWTAALLVEGIILILALEKYLDQTINLVFYSAMIIAIVITFLLNQREIQIFFHAQRHTHAEEDFGTMSERL